MIEKVENFLRIVAIAKIKMLSLDEGGKSMSVHVGYRPNHKLANGSFCMGLFSDIESGSIAPGSSSLVKIVFGVLAPNDKLFVKGMEWDINEGGEKVGAGELMEVLEKTILNVS